MTARTGRPDYHEDNPATFRFRPGLLDRIDAAAAAAGMSRTAWVSAAAEEKLGHDHAAPSAS